MSDQEHTNSDSPSQKDSRLAFLFEQRHKAKTSTDSSHSTSNDMSTDTTQNPQNSNSQNSTYTSSQNTSQKPVKKKKGFFQRVASFIRLVAIIAIILLLVLSGVFIYSLMNPNSQVANTSRWVVENTALNRFVDLPKGSNDTAASSSSSSSSQSQKIINNILGDIGNQNQSAFQFAEPQNGKPVTEIVQSVLPSVLSISLQSRGQSQNLSRDLVAGTGYVVSDDGLVVSNKHVISLACSRPTNVQITALSHDQKVYELTLLSVDPIDDIAILKVKNPDSSLKKVDFADSNTLRLGQDVIAIGNVFGELQNTVTRGIISGLNRNLSSEDGDLNDECTKSAFKPDGLIQTDAAINKGNSGGPLFNASGQLVGMNTLGTVGAQSVGLAIPSSTVLNALNSFQKNNKIVRARLGVVSQPLNPLLRSQNPWLPTNYGEIVFADQGEAVSKDSGADKAGIKEGDIILEVDGQKMEVSSDSSSPLRRAILSKQPTDSIELTVLKAKNRNGNGFTYDSTPIKVKATLGGISFDLPGGATL